MGLPWWFSGKEPASQCRGHGFNPWVQRLPGEGNGNPLQYSCLGNPMDREAWWAAVYGAAKSQTGLSDWTEQNDYHHRLANTSIMSHNYHFLSVVKALKIYLYFQVYNSILRSPITRLYMWFSRIYSSYDWNFASIDCVLVTQSCLPPCDPVDCSLQGPLSVGFSRKELWSGLPFTSPIHWLTSPISHRPQTLGSHIAGQFFTSWATREAKQLLNLVHLKSNFDTVYLNVYNS